LVQVTGVFFLTKFLNRPSPSLKKEATIELFRGNIKSILFVGICILYVVSVCVAYRKGWDSGVEKMRAEQNQVIIETHTQKTEIESEIAKKTVAEKRKGLGRYVVQAK
jgi:hypothetical protein